MGRPASPSKRGEVSKSDEPERANFRFPCGHEEDSDSLNRRMRTTERAAWVRCRVCNVIGLVVARPA